MTAVNNENSSRAPSGQRPSGQSQRPLQGRPSRGRGAGEVLAGASERLRYPRRDVKTKQDPHADG